MEVRRIKRTKPKYTWKDATVALFSILIAIAALPTVLGVLAFLFNVIVVLFLAGVCFFGFNKTWAMFKSYMKHLPDNEEEVEHVDGEVASQEAEKQ